MNQPKYIIVHHTAGPAEQTFQDINLYHQQRFNFISSMGYYIGYHYFIAKNGIIKQGRLDTDEGAHTIGKNLESLGVCLAGNFDVTLPTEAQIMALTSFLEKKSAEYKISFQNIVPHRTFANKTCYGVRLSNTWAADLLRTKYQKILNDLYQKVAQLLSLFKK